MSQGCTQKYGFEGEKPGAAGQPCEFQDRTRTRAGISGASADKGDRVPNRGVRPLPEGGGRALESISLKRRFEKKGHGHHGHSTGKRDAGEPPGQGRRDSRPHGARAAGPGVDTQPGDGRAGRRAVRGGEQEERLPGADAAHGRRGDHAPDTEAQGGELLPGRHREALLARGPGDGRLRARGVRAGALDQEDREGRRGPRVRAPLAVARVAHDRRPRRGGRLDARRALRRGALPLPLARRDLPQVPRRGARAVQGRRHRHRVRRGRVEEVRRLRVRRRRERELVEGVPQGPQAPRRLGREVRHLRRPRGPRPGGLRGLPGRRLAALHRAPRARRRRLVQPPRRPRLRAGGAQGGVRRARAVAGPRRLPQGLRGAGRDVGAGRRAPRGRRGGRARLPRLPLRAPREAPDEQRAGARERGDQAQDQGRLGLPLRRGDGAPRGLRAHRRQRGVDGHELHRRGVAARSREVDCRAGAAVARGRRAGEAHRGRGDRGEEEGRMTGKV